MADDAEAVKAEERGAAVLRIIDPATEPAERLARQHIADPAADGRPGVEQHGRGAAGRNDGGERRPIDARQETEGRVRGHDGGPGMTGAEQRVGAAGPDGLGGYPDGSAWLAPQRVRRALGHL